MLLLTCPIIFKAVQKMENHHEQGMQRDECNVHLKCKERLKVTLSKTVGHCGKFISILLPVAHSNQTDTKGVFMCLDLMDVWTNCHIFQINNFTCISVYTFFLTRLPEWARKEVMP